MATYEIFVATPKKPDFDWQEGGVEGLNLAVRVGGGLNAVLSLARTIDAEELEGRKLTGETWLAAGNRDQLLEVIDDNGWDHPDELDELPADGLFLVGLES
ncbi:MAG TPA: hypothetical protein PJ994_03760 [Tepidiformaceae bacterium]|nr:hypothetical protein [Tepidiformaceae bacterium]HMO97290.1 hypothetical protein [Tepidiformaceae bacterium]